MLPKESQEYNTSHCQGNRQWQSYQGPPEPLDEGETFYFFSHTPYLHHGHAIVKRM